jgi:hypothetical protein
MIALSHHNIKTPDMAKTSTLLNLIQFSYGEQSHESFENTLSDIHSSPEIYDQWLEIEQTKDELAKIEFRPRRSTVNSILNFSKSYAVRKSPSTGVHYEMQLN